MIDVDKNRLLEEIKNLINVHNFRLSIFHKVQELKGIYRKEIEDYTQLNAMIEPEADRVKAPGSFICEKFEIFRKGQTWEPTANLPPQITGYLLKAKTEPGITRMERCLQFPGLPHCYTISYERGDNRISGTIRVEKSETGHEQDLQPGYTNDDLKEFLSYILCHRSLCDLVLGQFKLKWKPFVDGREAKRRITAT